MSLQGIVLYMHAGSGNHGCEAIADSLLRMLPKDSVRLISCNEVEDMKYIPGMLTEVVAEKKMSKHPVKHALYYCYRKVTGDAESFLRYRFRAITRSKAPLLAVSIGGDNYCYPSMVGDLILTNRVLRKQGTKTMLLGCSIEPESLKGNEELLDDLRGFELIVARESMTYDALLAAGIPDHKIKLLPDPAFSLRTKELPLPKDFIPDETVGINLSPMVEQYAKTKGVTIECYAKLISHILETSRMHVALIPHVVWANNDDRKPLTELYQRFKSTGRVTLIEDCSAEALKGYISRCRLFIGARTHATIAAYSSYVPTLVLGYSVKALGIAKDLFGTTEHYVIPVQELEGPEQLIEEYEYLRSHERMIREELIQVMPDYQRRSRENGKEIMALYQQLEKINHR